MFILTFNFWSLLHNDYDYFYDTLIFKWASLDAQMVKNLPANARDVGSTPGSGRYPGGGHGIQFQYSCLENPMDRGAWQAYSPWDRKESDMTEQLHFLSFFHRRGGN